MMNWKKRKRAVSAIAVALAFMCMAQEMLCTVRAEAAELPAEEIVSSIAKQGDAASDAAEGILGMLGEQAGGEDDVIGITEGLRLGETNASLRASKSEQAGKKKLKNYILKHGKKMADGNKGITAVINRANVSIKSIIEYASSEKAFIFLGKSTYTYTGSNDKYYSTIEMRLPLNDTPKTIKVKSKGKITSANIGEWNSVGKVNVAKYQTDTQINFKISKFKINGKKLNISSLSEDIKQLSARCDSAFFELSMLGWDYTLAIKKVNTSMKEIGFRSYVR